AGALRPGPEKGVEQAVGIVHPLGVAGDLGADDAGRVAVLGGAIDPADAAPVDDLDLERAGRGAVMRAGRGAADGTDGLVHAAVLTLVRPGDNRAHGHVASQQGLRYPAAIGRP